MILDRNVVVGIILLYYIKCVVMFNTDSDVLYKLSNPAILFKVFSDVSNVWYKL